MKKLHTQLLRDDHGRYRIRLAKNQDDPILCVGSGQLNSMSPGMWEVFKKAQEAQDAFQAALAELFCSDQFPFEENSGNRATAPVAISEGQTNETL